MLPCAGGKAMGTDRFLVLLYCWQIWSFIIVSWGLTGFLAFDSWTALQNRHQPRLGLEMPTLSIQGHQAGLAGICMTQEVELVQEALPESPIAEKDMKMRF